MNSSFAPDLTPFVVAFVLIDLLAVLAVVGVAAVPVVGFFARNHSVRVRRHEGLFHYYGHLTLGR
jgi:hypothetical protein